MTALKITLIQSDLFWESPEKNRKKFDALIESIGQATHLIVLPEMFTTGFTMNCQKWAETMSGQSIEWMKTIAKNKKCAVTGSLIIKEGKNFYNRLIWMMPDGQIFHYDKRHLFSYGNEHLHYKPGKQKLIVNYRGWNIQPLICYDLRFPVWCRNQIEPQTQTYNYDLILFVANWPHKRIEAWHQLLIARAIENQSFAVGVNRIGYDGNDIYHSGSSSLIHPEGKIIFRQMDKPEVVTLQLSYTDLKKSRDKYHFLFDGDSFKIET